MSRSGSPHWGGFLLLVGLAGCASEAPTTGPAARTRANPADGAEMVYVPPGEFVMGSDAADIDRVWRAFGWPDEWKGHAKSEQPAHRVRVPGFWMYRDDVTVSQYRKYCAATGRAMPAAPSWGWREDHPVVNVSWEDAKAYCSWAGARLPYEAEWEYAARAGNTGLGGKARTAFVWGDDFPEAPVANLADVSFKQSRLYNPSFRLFPGYDDGHTHTSPVGAFPPNGYGLRDMAGNVWQWCEDWFEEGYYGSSPAESPRGPAKGARRVLRGGAFDTTPEMTRIARRVSNSPDVRHDEKGFRCVQER